MLGIWGLGRLEILCLELADTTATASVAEVVHLACCGPSQDYGAMLRDAGFDSVAALDRTEQVRGLGPGAGRGACLCCSHLCCSPPTHTASSAWQPGSCNLFPLVFTNNHAPCPQCCCCRSSKASWSGSLQLPRHGRRNLWSSAASKTMTRWSPAGATSWHGSRRGSSAGGCSVPSAPPMAATSTRRSTSCRRCSEQRGCSRRSKEAAAAAETWRACTGALLLLACLRSPSGLCWNQWKRCALHIAASSTIITAIFLPPPLLVCCWYAAPLRHASTAFPHSFVCPSLPMCK